MLLSFLLVVFGLTSIVMQMVGVRWAFMGFIESGGRLFAFLIKVLMLLSGIVLFIVSNIDWEKEREDSAV